MLVTLYLHEGFRALATPGQSAWWGRAQPNLKARFSVDLRLGLGRRVLVSLAGFVAIGSIDVVH